MTETELKVVNTENILQLEMHGEFTTRSSEAIKKDLVLSVSREGSQLLNLANAIAMDVAGIQLAYAWKKAMEQNQKNATITLPTSESVVDLLSKTGITQIL